MENRFKDFDILKMAGFRPDFNFENRFDLKTRVGNYEISTVDLGIDHNFGFGKPLYYETMIFKYDENDEIDYYGEFDYLERYSTEDEAREGHKRAIKFIEEMEKDKC